MQGQTRMSVEMKKLFSCVLLILIFTACTQNMERLEKAAEDSAPVMDLKEKVRSTDLNFLESVIIPGTDCLMYPVSAKLEADDQPGLKSRSLKREIWNLVFYNYKTRESHLLFANQPPIIESYPQNLHIPGTGMMGSSQVDISPANADYLFFEATVSDYNGNEQLDDQDPTYLFVSNMLGKELRQISPDLVDVRSWKFINNERTVIEISGKTDSNENQEFDGLDREFLYLIDLEDENFNHEVFTKPFQDSLKAHYMKKI